MVLHLLIFVSCSIFNGSNSSIAVDLIGGRDHLFRELDFNVSKNKVLKLYHGELKENTNSTLDYDLKIKSMDSSSGSSRRESDHYQYEHLVEISGFALGGALEEHSLYWISSRMFILGSVSSQGQIGRLLYWMS